MLLIYQIIFQRWVLIIVLCCLSGNVFAQSIEAIVSDRETGLPIEGVRVNGIHSAHAALTNQHGRFVIKDIPSGSLVRFIAAGYITLEQPVNDSTIKITMEPSPIYLHNNLTITAKRFERNQFDVAESITILNAQELQQTAPRSAPESLIGSTGIWIQKTNHGGGSPIIRGLVGNQVLLMIDGIRLNNATYRYGPNQYLSTIDPGIIDRMEATRGNGSVLYGSDALGGVVQIISKRPHFQNEGARLHGEVTSRWMSGDMEKSGRAEINFSGERFAFLGGFSARNFGDIVAGGDLGTLDPTGYQEFSGDAKILMKAGNYGVVTAAWQNLTQSEVPRYDQVVQGGYERYHFDPQSRQLSYVRWETSAKSPWLNSIRITSAFNRSVEGITSQKYGSAEVKTQKDRVNTWSLTGEVHSLIKDHWWMQSGVEFYHDIVKSRAKISDKQTAEETMQRGSFADGSTSSSLAIYNTHEFDWKRFVFSAGGRFNMISVSVNDPIFGNQRIKPDALVGNIEVIYKASQKHRLIAGVNTGFRAPNVDDISKFGPVESTVFEIPAENLSPERSFTAEVGIKSKTKNFSGSFTAYHTKLFDLIDRMPTAYLGEDTIDNRRVYRKQNIARSELYGFEAEGEIKMAASWVAFANFTYTYGQNISGQEPMRRIPPLFGRVGVRYQHSSGFWARLENVMAGDQNRLARGDKADARIAIRLVNDTMPGWSIVNLHTGYSYRAFNLTLSAQNIFNKAYRIYASGVDSYGRSFTACARVRF